MRIQQVFQFAILLLLAGCSNDELPYDAYGHFEADEWNLGPEVSGTVLDVFADEGDKIEKGQILAQIDTTEFVLNLRKLEAVWSSLDAKLVDPSPDIRVLDERERVLKREIARVENLLAGGAATEKQLDDLNGELSIVQQQKAAAISKSKSSNRAILSERSSIEAEMDIVRDKISRCTLRSPAAGRIVVRNVEPGEVAMPGRMFFKLAALDEIYVRAYIEGSRLNEINLGTGVQVGITGGDTLNGTITWVSEKAEFSPKFVETREERADRVYAFKVKVNNNGMLKIGMPAEIYLEKQNGESTLKTSATEN